jgi:hypothetical protein
MTDRYDTTGNLEDEYYSGTSVLINLEDIHDPEELLERETKLQLGAYEQIFSLFDESLTPDLPFFYYLHYMMFSPLFVRNPRLFFALIVSLHQTKTRRVREGGQLYLYKTEYCPAQR